RKAVTGEAGIAPVVDDRPDLIARQHIADGVRTALQRQRAGDAAIAAMNEEQRHAIAKALIVQACAVDIRVGHMHPPGALVGACCNLSNTTPAALECGFARGLGVAMQNYLGPVGPRSSRGGPFAKLARSQRLDDGQAILERLARGMPDWQRRLSSDGIGHTR